MEIERVKTYLKRAWAKSGIDSSKLKLVWEKSGADRLELKEVWEKSGIDRLSSRERWMLLGALVFITGFVVFQFMLVPYFDAKENITKSIAKREADLIKIKQLSTEYLALKADEGNIQARLDKRDRKFTLFTFSDEQAGKAGVKKQIQYMKPSIIEGDEQFNESVVEIKLEKITLKALVEFLLLIESKENVVFIKRMSIQESGEGKGHLDSILQLATFSPKE